MKRTPGMGGWDLSGRKRLILVSEERIPSMRIIEKSWKFSGGPPWPNGRGIGLRAILRAMPRLAWQTYSRVIVRVVRSKAVKAPRIRIDIQLPW